MRSLVGRPWTPVDRNKKKKKMLGEHELCDTKPKKGRRLGSKREKIVALIKTIESKYSEVLKATSTDVKFVNLGADVRII